MYMNAPHRHTIDTIPWLANGRISDEERRVLDEHLVDCAECNAEFELQQRIHSAMTHDESRVDYAPGASLQKLWSRIGNEEETQLPIAVSAAVANARNLRPRMMQWLVAAVVVEAIGITLLSVMQGTTPAPTAAVLPVPPPVYRTVTTTTVTVPTSAALRVVFAASFTVADVNALLAQYHLEIVSGPSAREGAYGLATTVAASELPDTIPHMAASLRAHPGVRLAEPLVQTSASKP